MNVIIVKPKKQVRHPSQPLASAAGSSVALAVGHVQPGHGLDRADKAAASEACLGHVLHVLSTLSVLIRAAVGRFAQVVFGG
jgi:hypothetical protein